jgi:hypothetical protein
MNSTLCIPVLGLFMALSLSCARTVHRSDAVNVGIFSETVRQQLRTVERSVVGVGAAYTYRVEILKESHDTKQAVWDVVAVSDTIIETYGAGLVLHHDDSRAVILTVHHLLRSDDTIITYRRSPEGKETNIPATRAIKIKSTYFVDDQTPDLKNAEILCTDRRSDLGLLVAEMSLPKGLGFGLSIAYDRTMQLGEIVYLFGFPRQTKQVTFGIVSPSRYPGNFVIDAVTRFGYSGGPIFAVGEDGALALAGIVRAMAAEEIDFVAPPPDAFPGSQLSPEELARVRASRKHLIEYGMTFGIEAERIGQFLTGCRTTLQGRGIVLPPQCFPP